MGCGSVLKVMNDSMRFIVIKFEVYTNAQLYRGATVFPRYWNQVVDAVGDL